MDHDEGMRESARGVQTPSRGTGSRDEPLSRIFVRTCAAATAAVLAGILAATFHACGGAEQATCDPVACELDCRLAGWPGGACTANACECDRTVADADAGVPGEDAREGPDAEAVRPDRPDLGTEDVRDLDVDIRDEPDEGLRPEIICELPAEDRPDVPPPEYVECCPVDTGSSESKSGCDPLLCFMSCGGTCTPAGDCRCAPPLP